VTTNGTKYPDSPPDALGDLKSIRRTPEMATGGLVPRIRWGDEYQSWPIEKRLSYAERLASSMNHAADILQQERDKLIAVVQHQEAQLRENVAKYLEQGALLHRELGAAGAREQELATLVVQLQAEVKEKAARVRVLEATRGAVDQ
jgi:hypothetical protein